MIYARLTLCPNCITSPSISIPGPHSTSAATFFYLIAFGPRTLQVARSKI